MTVPAASSRSLRYARTRRAPELGLLLDGTKSGLGRAAWRLQRPLDVSRSHEKVPAEVVWGVYVYVRTGYGKEGREEDSRSEETTTTDVRRWSSRASSSAHMRRVQASPSHMARFVRCRRSTMAGMPKKEKIHSAIM